MSAAYFFVEQIKAYAAPYDGALDGDEAIYVGAPYFTGGLYGGALHGGGALCWCRIL